MLSATRRVAAVGVARLAPRSISTGPVALTGSKDDKSHDEFDDDVFELLPPGSSMRDPLDGLGPDDKVHLHGKARSLEHADEEPDHAPPRFVATHKDASKDKVEEEEDDDAYVYLPPGSSLREPGDSLSDTSTEKRIYFRDPSQ